MGFLNEEIHQYLTILIKTRLTILVQDHVEIEGLHCAEKTRKMFGKSVKKTFFLSLELNALRTKFRYENQLFLRIIQSV